MAKKLIGTVTSTKMNKTVVVSIEKKLRHPRYQKVIIRTVKFKAHTDLENLIVGNMVEITESRPLSKEKSFIVTKKIS